MWCVVWWQGVWCGGGVRCRVRVWWRVRVVVCGSVVWCDVVWWGTHRHAHAHMRAHTAGGRRQAAATCVRRCCTAHPHATHARTRQQAGACVVAAPWSTCAITATLRIARFVGISGPSLLSTTSSCQLHMPRDWHCTTAGPATPRRATPPTARTACCTARTGMWLACAPCTTARAYRTTDILTALILALTLTERPPVCHRGGGCCGCAGAGVAGSPTPNGGL